MLRRVPLEQLEPGMVIAEVSALWQHHPTIYTIPGSIRSADHIRRLRDQGYTEALVDVARSPMPIPGESPTEADLARRMSRDGHEPPRAEVPVEQELAPARQAFGRTREVMGGLVESVRMGRSLDVEGARLAVEEVMGSLARNPAGMNLLARLSRHDDYTYAHSVNVGVIALTFGHYLGLSGDELREVGMAGLFHDLGKLKVPARIIRKRGRLTDEEFAIMRTHPMLGHDLLDPRTDIPDHVKHAVVQHHERHNGEGYPDGLAGESISLTGRILALADVYDALTTDRSYRSALVPGQAMSLLFSMRDEDFRALELELFIKCLGIYPPGGLVRLSTGDVAIVLENNHDHPLWPKVKVILDARMAQRKPVVLDLAELRREVEQPPFIVGSVEASSVPGDLARLLAPRA